MPTCVHGSTGSPRTGNTLARTHHEACIDSRRVHKKNALKRHMTRRRAADSAYARQGEGNKVRCRLNAFSRALLADPHHLNRIRSAAFSHRLAAGDDDRVAVIHHAD
jgi:hypothetical protein